MLITLFLVLSVTVRCGSYSSYTRLKSRSVSSVALQAQPEPTTGPDQSEYDDPDVVYINSEDDLPDDVRLEMDGRYSDGPDIPTRLQSMGFTPLTVAGYVLAFSIIGLNNILGDGWASNMISMGGEGTTMSSQSRVVVDPTDAEQVRSLQKALFESVGNKNDDDPTPITSR